MNAFLDGFLLQASLILALGAQNLFVLESGLKKQRHLLVAALCSLCDAVLIAIGVMGAASIFARDPWLKIGFGIVGVAFLFYYGVKKLLEGLYPKPIVAPSGEVAASARQVVLLTLGFSLLNPHVYLDTVILIGGYSTIFPDFWNRLQFGAGAASFSVLWFFGLALFAFSLHRFLNTPKAMRWVALISGAVLLALSWKLGTDVYGWIYTV